MRIRWSAGAARIGAILAIAAVPRIWAAVRDQGIFWPDEIFQSTEQAHRFAFGYGFVSWEFQEGARSWLFPGLLGLFWKGVAALGFGTAPALMISVKLLMAALGLAGGKGKSSARSSGQSANGHDAASGDGSRPSNAVSQGTP